MRYLFNLKGMRMCVNSGSVQINRNKKDYEHI